MHAPNLSTRVIRRWTLLSALCVLGGTGCFTDFTNTPETNDFGGNSDGTGGIRAPRSILIIGHDESEEDSLLALMETARLRAAGRDSAGRDITGLTFTWASDDPSIAAVDNAGTVTAKGNGTTLIRASAQGVTATHRVVVRQAIAELVIIPSGDTIEQFDSRDYAAAATDANGHALARSITFEWDSSSDRRVTVYADPDDSRKAVAWRWRDGKVTITVKAEQASGSATAY